MNNRTKQIVLNFWIGWMAARLSDGRFDTAAVDALLLVLLFILSFCLLPGATTAEGKTR